jgi:hypothetical protein
MTKSFLLLLIFLLPIKSFAMDNWYIQLLIGQSLYNTEYDKIDKVRDRFESNFNIEENTDYQSLRGFALYYTLNEKWLIGVSSMESSGSMYGDLKSNGDDLRITYGFNLRNLSAIHYFMGKVGDGYFARADLGDATVYTNYSDEDSLLGSIFDPDNTDGTSYSFNDKGQAISLGGGRSWAITEGSSFDLGLVYSFIQTSEANMSFLFLTGSFTW